MEFHLHVHSRPSLSLFRIAETGRPPVAFLHLRLSEARPPFTFSPSGEVDSPDLAVRLERAVMFEDLSVFLRPEQSRDAVARMLASSLSGWAVDESTFADFVSRVCNAISYSAAQTLSVAPCNLTATVNICRLLDQADGGSALGRALLASREVYERERGFGGVPAQEAAIEGLETGEYAGERENCCAVCYEEFVPGQELKKMPCGHLFHGGCIVQWLRASHRCPLCRFEMPRREAAPSL